jgi:hypothetical protein
VSVAFRKIIPLCPRVHTLIFHDFQFFDWTLRQPLKNCMKGCA